MSWGQPGPDKSLFTLFTNLVIQSLIQKTWTCNSENDTIFTKHIATSTTPVLLGPPLYFHCPDLFCRQMVKMLYIADLHQKAGFLLSLYVISNIVPPVKWCLTIWMTYRSCCKSFSHCGSALTLRLHLWRRSLRTNYFLTCACVHAVN